MMKHVYMEFCWCFCAITMKMVKGIMIKMSNRGIVRVLERDIFMPYCQCWYSRDIFEGGVVVALFRQNKFYCLCTR